MTMELRVPGAKGPYDQEPGVQDRDRRDRNNPVQPPGDQECRRHSDTGRTHREQDLRDRGAGESGKIKKEEVLQYCSPHLPKYMVPEIIEFRESLPATSSGKMDRKKMSERGMAVHLQPDTEGRTSMQKLIRNKWYRGSGEPFARPDPGPRGPSRRAGRRPHPVRRGRELRSGTGRRAYHQRSPGKR